MPPTASATAAPRRAERAGRPIAHHLVALALAILLPVLGLAAALAWSYAASERARVEQMALRTAADASLAVERELAGLAAATEVLALSPLLRAGDLDAFDAQAREVRDRLGVNVVMRDLQSRQVVNTRLPRGAPLPVGDSRGSDARVLATGRPDISDLIQGAVARRPLFIVNVPVRRDGEVTHLLNLALAPDRIRDILRESARPPGWRIRVVDRQGDIVADSTERHEAVLGSPLPPTLRAALDAPQGVAWLDAAGDGGALLIAQQRSPLSGWTTIVAVPEAQAEAALRRSLVLLAALAAFLLALAGVAASLVGHRIARPVMRLAALAQRLGQGAEIAPIATPLREATLVASALADASVARRAQESALRQSEERFRALSEATREGVAIHDAGRIVEANGAFWRMFGHPSREAVIGRDPFAFIAPAERLAVAERIGRGETDAYESLGLRADGTRFPAEFQGRPISYLGRAMRVGVVRDLSGQKAAEAALRESEARLRLALEAGGLGSWEVDLRSGMAMRAGRVVPGRPGLPLAGYPLEAFFAQVVHPEDVAGLRAAFSEVAQGRAAQYRIEYRVRGADDASWIWMESFGGVAEHDPAGGTPLRVAGVSRDISERKRAEAALAESEARLRAVLEQMPVGVAIAEVPSGRLLFHNRRAVELIGHPMLPADDIGGYAGYGALAEDGSPLPPEAYPIARAVRDGATVEHEEMAYRRGDGSLTWLEVSAAPVRGPAGKATLAVSTFADISARKAAEEHRRLLMREVDHRAKNALAVAQSVVTLTRAEDPQAYARAVGGRIGALARAHTRLAEGGWTGTELRALIADELQGFGAAPPGQAEPASPARVKLCGPPVVLPPQAAAPVAMILHELATNAAKHGALSDPAGRVAVRWTTAPGDRLRLCWEECGGPPVRGRPARRGFGSRLLDATAGRQLGGEIRFAWDAQGLRCELEFPMRRPDDPPPG